MKRAIALCFVLAFSGVLLADAPETRVPSRQTPSPSLFQDLVRMTKAGLSEATVLEYAKAHRAELPSEISADDLIWLRKSGVSESVVRYMSAIDVRASGDYTEQEEDVPYDSRAAERYPAAPEDSYPVADYNGGYPDTDYDYGSYPESYYNDYYPYYPVGYYPYPVYFFANQGAFFGFHHHGRGFDGRHGRGFGHGGFGRPRSPRFPRGDFDRGRRGGDFDRGRRGSVAAVPRAPGRPAVARGNFGPGFQGSRAGIVRRGGSPAARSAFPRGGFGQGSPGPRAPVIRSAGPGHAGGGVARGPAAGSGGGGRMSVTRPSGGRR